MSKIDIVIYVILGVALIVGLKKGFVKQVFSFANALVSLVVSYFFVKPFTQFLSSTNILTKINTTILTWVNNKNAALDVLATSNYKEEIQEGITSLGIPGFISNILSGNINISDEKIASGITVSGILSESIGYIVLSIFAFIVLFIVCLIVIKVLSKLFESITEKGLLKTIDRLLGMVLTGAIAAIVVSLLMLGLSAVAGMNETVNEFVIEDLKIGVDTGFSIGKYVYENNPLKWIFENVIDLDKLFT